MTPREPVPALRTQKHEGGKDDTLRRQNGRGRPTSGSARTRARARQRRDRVGRPGRPPPRIMSVTRGPACGTLLTISVTIRSVFEIVGRERELGSLYSFIGEAGGG